MTNIAIANQANHELTPHIAMVGAFASQLGSGDRIPDLAKFMLRYVPHDIGKFGKYQSLFRDITPPTEPLDARHNETGWCALVLSDYMHRLYTHMHPNDTTPRPIVRDWADAAVRAVYFHHENGNREDVNSDIHAIINSSSDEVEIAIRNLPMIESLVNLDELLPSTGIKSSDTYARLRSLPVPTMYDLSDDYSNYTTEKTKLLLAYLRKSDFMLSSLSLVGFNSVYAKFAETGVVDVSVALDSNFTRFPRLHISADRSYTTPPEWIETTQTKVQNDCLNDVIAANTENGATVFINGPAGIGKTNIATRLALETGVQLVIVCPLLDITRSDYDEILKLRQRYNLHPDLSIEIITGCEKQDGTHPDTPPFSSDIIVMNVDTLANMFIRNNLAHALTLITSATIVFDESQLLLADNPMFVVILSILKMRHMYTNSLTVLMSATNIRLDMFLSKHYHNDAVKECVWLPSKSSHYPAQHQKPYIFKECINPDDLNTQSLIAIHNRTRSARKYAASKPKPGIYISSDMTPADRRKVVDYLIKKCKGIHSNKGTGTPLLRTALDYSAQGIWETVSSPRDTTQAFGRDNRHGEYDIAYFGFSLIPYSERGEVAAQANRWGVEQNQKSTGFRAADSIKSEWYVELRKLANSNTQYTLDEYYLNFNAFYMRPEIIKWENEYLMACYARGAQALKALNPRIKKTPTKTSDAKFTGATLRSTVPSFFVSMRYADSDEWMSRAGSSDLFTTADFNATKSIESHSNADYRLTSLSKQEYMLLVKQLGEVYPGWTKMYRKNAKIPTPSDWRKLGRCSDTPIPMRYVRYHRDTNPDHNSIGFFGMGMMPLNELDDLDAE